MKRVSSVRCGLYALVLAMGYAASAAAQNPYNAAQQPSYQQAYESQAQYFPKLPPSRACTMQDLAGIWKILLVYEKPVGPDMTNFVTNPVQYLLFNTDSTFGIINGHGRELPPVVIRDIGAKEQAQALLQYVVDASGFIFFYQNKQATDTKACFIVAVQEGQFYPGQMLLMPPEGQSKERLLKVYSKVNEQRANGQRFNGANPNGR